MTELQKMAAKLRRRGISVSLASAKAMAKEHGLKVSHSGRFWCLYRSDGFGHMVTYHHLVELVAALAPPR